MRSAAGGHPVQPTLIFVLEGVLVDAVHHQPVAHTTAALERLHDAPKCLLSGLSVATQQSLLEQGGLASRFAPDRRFSVVRQPDGAVDLSTFQHIVQALDTAPQQCVVITACPDIAFVANYLDLLVVGHAPQGQGADVLVQRGAMAVFSDMRSLSAMVQGVWNHHQTAAAPVTHDHSHGHSCCAGD